MEEKIDRRVGFGNLAGISLLASVLGSALAAVIFSVIHGNGGVFPALNAAVIVFLFGSAIGVPTGLLVGIPMLAVSRRLLPHHIVVATLGFAITGLLGGFVMKHFAGGAGLGNAEVIFGACVGGMHPLVFGRANGVKGSRIFAALLFSAVAVPAAAFAGESVQNLIGSHQEFETRCADRYGTMAFVADRAALERRRRPAQGKGNWYNQRRWRSLYARENWTVLDEAHILIMRDYAYVPGGFAGWITGGRRVERHCLSEKKGSEADMLRRRGFGKRPSLGDLAD